MQRTVYSAIAAALALAPALAFAQTATPAGDASQAGWTATLYFLLVVLIFAVGLFVWWFQKQNRDDAPGDDRDRR